MNITYFITKDYENELCQKLQKNKPKQTKFQTRSEFIPKGAEIPTGELLGILKLGTNQPQSPRPRFYPQNQRYPEKITSKNPIFPKSR